MIEDPALVKEELEAGKVQVMNGVIVINAFYSSVRKKRGMRR